MHQKEQYVKRVKVDETHNMCQNMFLNNLIDEEIEGRKWERNVGMEREIEEKNKKIEELENNVEELKMKVKDLEGIIAQLKEK